MSSKRGEVNQQDISSKLVTRPVFQGEGGYESPLQNRVRNET